MYSNGNLVADKKQHSTYICNWYKTRKYNSGKIICAQKQKQKYISVGQ